MRAHLLFVPMLLCLGCLDTDPEVLTLGNDGVMGAPEGYTVIPSFDEEGKVDSVALDFVDLPSGVGITFDEEDGTPTIAASRQLAFDPGQWSEMTVTDRYGDLSYNYIPWVDHPDALTFVDGGDLQVMHGAIRADYRCAVCGKIVIAAVGGFVSYLVNAAADHFDIAGHILGDDEDAPYEALVEPVEEGPACQVIWY